MALIGRLITRLTNLASSLGAACILLSIGHVTLDVTMRVIFGMPLSGTVLFVSVYYMVAIAFLAIAAVERHDAHISVEVVTSLLPRRPAAALQGLSLLLTAVVAGALALRTWQEAMVKFRVGAFTMEAGDRIYTWPSYFILPVGFGLMLLVALWKLARFSPASPGNGRAATSEGAGDE